MWAFARMSLGLSDSEFWSLTFAHFWALSRQYRDIHRREDWRHGNIAAILLNTNLKKGAKKVDATTFMIDPPVMEKKVQSPEQMLAFVKNVLHPAFGGKEFDG